MELNYLKFHSIQTVQPIELKFATYDVKCFVMHCADFGEYRSIGIFYRRKRDNSYTLKPMDLNYLKCDSIPNGATY